MALSGEARRRIASRIAWLSQEGNTLVIDGDTHPSDPGLYPKGVRERMARDPNYYHGRPISGDELIADMNKNGVDAALSWQNPSVLEYTEDPGENARRLLAANRAILDLSERHPRRIIPAGWTDPKALGIHNALQIVRTCVEEFGFPVVKLNPAQNAYPVDSREVLEIVDAIVSLGAVPAIHYGGDTPYTPAHGLDAVARRIEDHPIIAVHMGGGGSHYVEGEALYQESRALGLRQPNIFYVLSAKRDTHIESDLIAYQLAGEPYKHNIGVGSDAPYGRISWNFGGYRAMFAALADGASHNDPRLREKASAFDAASVHGYMGGNLAALILQADRSILGKN